MAADIGVYNFSWRDMGVPTLFKMMDIVQVKQSLLLNLHLQMQGKGLFVTCSVRPFAAKHILIHCHLCQTAVLSLQCLVFSCLLHDSCASSLSMPDGTLQAFSWFDAESVTHVQTLEVDLRPASHHT